jgi:cellobiose phosphorylase
MYYLSLFMNSFIAAIRDYRKWILFLIVCFFRLQGQAQSPGAKQSWYSFSADGKECILTNSGLPTPWLNRLGNDVFFTWVTHNGYIESFLLDPVQNGLTNPQNTSGRFYLRDQKTAEYFEINQPSPGGQWESHIGLGYNKIVNKAHGLESSISYFVPRSDDVLLMIVEINNTGTENRSLDLFGEVEWNLGDPVKSFIYRGDGRGGSQFNLYKKAWMEDNIILARQLNWKSTANCSPWPYEGFFSVNEPVKSYETIKENFLGVGMDYDHPEAVAKGSCTKTDFWSRAQYPLGVLQNAVELKPGEKKTFVYVLGMSRDKSQIKRIVQKYHSLENANRVLNDLKTFYGNLVDAGVHIETPDKDNDRLINIWTKYHWRQIWKKSLNTAAYGMGLWSYGLEGESISVHPEQVLLPLDMSLLKSGITDLLENEVSDTTATYLFGSSHSMLYADLGVTGIDQYFKGRFKVTHHHQIWGFLFPIYFYLLESGDQSFLDTMLPFQDGTKGTVWEHIKRAIAISTNCIDDRGLARIPANVGDWMDEFTKISKNDSAESVMMAGEIAFLLKGFSEMAGQYNKPADLQQWMAIYNKIKNGVNQYAWDGNWYIRAFSDRARPMIPVGSHENEEGKIYLNAQSWSVLSGIAPPDRAISSMESVGKMLVSDYGPMVFYPSYSKYVDYIGTQSIYAPGFRNGCIYLRPTGWAIIAACMNDQPGLANEMYNKASLNARAKDMEHYHCEPYVYPENYDGPDHLLKGQGEFQWNFGEGAGWMWASYVDYILGVRPMLTGLLVDPKIPSEWPGYRVRRTFRGNIYEIEVRNPNHSASGIGSVSVDEKMIKGNLIEATSTNKIFKVLVIMK